MLRATWKTWVSKIKSALLPCVRPLSGAGSSRAGWLLHALTIPEALGPERTLMTGGVSLLGQWAALGRGWAAVSC